MGENQFTYKNINIIEKVTYNKQMIIRRILPSRVGIRDQPSASASCDGLLNSHDCFKGLPYPIRWVRSRQPKKGFKNGDDSPSVCRRMFLSKVCLNYWLCCPIRESAYVSRKEWITKTCNWLVLFLIDFRKKGPVLTIRCSWMDHFMFSFGNYKIKSYFETHISGQKRIYL